VKKQITFALLLMVGAGKCTASDHTKAATIGAIGTEALSGLTHAWRLGKATTSKSAKEIKVTSALAALTNLAALLAHGYQGYNEANQIETRKTGLKKLKNQYAETLLYDCESLIRHGLEAFNAIRMYRNAENIAKLNAKNHQRLLKTKAFLITTLLANRWLRAGTDLHRSGLFKSPTDFLGVYYKETARTFRNWLHLSTLVPAFYELGMFNGSNQATSATTHQVDNGDEEDADE